MRPKTGENVGSAVPMGQTLRDSRGLNDLKIQNSMQQSLNLATITQNYGKKGLAFYNHGK